MKLSLHNFYGPSTCLGVLIGDKSIRALAVDQASISYKPVWSNAVVSEVPLLSDPNDYSVLRKHLSDLVPGIKAYSKGVMPIQLALADPVISNYFLEFASLPGGDEERHRLITWQLSKHYHIDFNKYALTYQYMGKYADKHLVFALVTDSLLIDSIMDEFRRVNLSPTTFDAGGCYLYNVLSQAVRSSQGAMAINLEDGYWTIMIWDECASLQYMRSKWHDGFNGDPNSYRELVMDIERTARAFVYHKQGVSIEAIYLCGDSSYTSMLGTQLRDKVQESCTIHDGNTLFAQGVVDGANLSMMLLATALCRNS